MGRPPKPFVRQPLTKGSILPVPRSKPQFASKDTFQTTTKNIKTKHEDAFKVVPWNKVPLRRPEEAKKISGRSENSGDILSPSWLEPSKKLFPYRRYAHRHPGRLFFENQALRTATWREELKPKYFIFDRASPELDKIGHTLLPHWSNPSMVASVEILTTPTADTPGGSVFLRYDHRSYVFGNASEGTQRVFTSRGLSMAKIEDIFLTGLVDWHGNGGLLGMVLTLADIRSNRVRDREERDRHKKVVNRLTKSGELKTGLSIRRELDHLNIHGGKNLTQMLATARGFIYRNGYPLSPQEIRNDPRPNETCDGKHDWEDENIQVWHVPVFATEPATGQQKSNKRSFESISDSDGEDPKAKVEPGAEASSKGLPKRTPGDEAKDQELVLGVVKSMFNSDGFVDGLYEAKLENVNPPARLYMENEDKEIVPYTGEVVSRATVIVRKPTLVKTLPPTEPARMSMCYVVKTKKQRGKFFPEKATALGVPKQQFKNLTAGESVPGHGGLLVTPDMVMGDAPPPNGFAVVELPDESYIEPFLARPEWKNEDIMRGMRAFYWNMRDPKLIEDQRILDFMAKHNGPKHIVLSRRADISPIVLEGAALETAKLHMIDSDVFPLLPYSDPSPETFRAVPNVPRNMPDQALYQHGRLGAEITLAPKLKFNDDKILHPIDARKALETFAEQNTEIISLAQAAKAKISDPAFLAAVEAADADIPNRDAEIIPLGTGSALPSKTRNVSCTLIRVPGIGNYLLDCGENSLGQLRRMYGFSGADEILKDLKAIWISHSHADHHLGTISILRRFSEVVPATTSPVSVAGKTLTLRPLALIAHPAYHNFISEYAEIENFGLDTHIHQLTNAPVSSKKLNRSASHITTHHHPPAILSHFGIQTLAVCKVDHCADSYAVAITLTSGLKIAYSGDCRPSRNFAEVGRDAHLLIHEATLEDGKQADAEMKKHCTVSEALAVARGMRARNILLTHFSQRYPAMPVFDRRAVAGGQYGSGGDDGWEERDAPVLVAFDFMRVRLGDFRKARAFLPALQKLYEAPDEGVEAAGDKGEIDGVEGEVIASRAAA